MGRGHPVGDFLEAHEWRVEDEREGFLRLRVHLPRQVRNPRGELFGGFTPTYVDLVALHTVRAGDRGRTGRWLTTADMRVDYFSPVREDVFVIESDRLFHISMVDVDVAVHLELYDNILSTFEFTP